MAAPMRTCEKNLVKTAVLFYNIMTVLVKQLIYF